MHMLHRWLGDADFAKGLHACFEKHQYKAIPSAVTFGMPLVKHQAVMLQLWILGCPPWLPSTYC